MQAPVLRCRSPSLRTSVTQTPSRPSGQDAADPQETSHKESVPTISITKPPAPLPVDLPTHDEITPPSLDFESRPDDIESGGSIMREVSLHSRTATDLSSPGLQQDVLSSPKSVRIRCPDMQPLPQARLLHRLGLPIYLETLCPRRLHLRRSVHYPRDDLRALLPSSSMTKTHPIAAMNQMRRVAS